MQTELRDFRTFLLAELARRQRETSAYSLRAFARELDLEPSFLSKILRGKKKVSASTFNRVVSKFQLTTDQRVHFEKEFLTTKSNKQRKSAASINYHKLTDIELRIISEWHFSAILELTRLKCFRPDSSWIAGKLGLTVKAVEDAVALLLKSGYLEISADDKWIDKIGAMTTIHDPRTSEAQKKYIKQIFEINVEAVEGVPFEMRDLTTMIIPFNLKDLPAVRERIRKFRHSMAKYIERRAEFDEVYELSVAFTPAKRISKKRSF